MSRSQIQRTACLAGFVILVVTVFAWSASAGTVTVFTNFGSNHSFNTSRGFGVLGPSAGSTAVGMPFTAGSTADLADAILALDYGAGANSPITLDLESNSSGVPGTILATLTQQGTIPSSPGLVNFDYAGTTVQLTSGTMYWLVALQTNPGTVQTWYFSNSDIGNVVLNFSDSATGPWTTENNDPVSAFQVDGALQPTPEPGTFLLVALGMLCGVAALGLERKRLKAVASDR